MDTEIRKAPIFKGLLHFIGLPWIVKWWRRRELNPRPKTFNRKLIHAYPLIYSSRFLRRLRESSGIGQPGSSYRSAPDLAERPARIVTSLQPLGRQPGDALLS